MSTHTSHEDQTSTSEVSGVEFGTSVDGFPLARIGDTVLAMLPGRDDGHRLAFANLEIRPLGALNRDDFYRFERSLADEAAFIACVAETAQQKREVSRLNRTIIRMQCHTPWGAPQHSELYAEGVVAHSTASHGGFHLSPERNRLVNPDLRKSDGFYEEDEEWAIVALTFPDLFSTYERKCADKTIKDWRPEAWQAIFGRQLAPGESRVKDRKAFEAKHAHDWIVIAAIRSDRHSGMVETIATRGGLRPPPCRRTPLSCSR